MLEVTLVRARDRAITPRRMSADAAGYDLFACLPEGEPVSMGARTRFVIPTGWRLAIPAGYEGQVRPRSGLAFRHGITVLNAPGTVDADYRGELKVLLVNLGAESFQVAHGERIAQLVVAPVSVVQFTEANAFCEPTERGVDGFGSTGR